MNVGLNTLYNIGSNYSLRLNGKGILVYEDDDITYILTKEGWLYLAAVIDLYCKKSCRLIYG